ncbi:hypothetical protein TNCV_2446551 [Trichonephila clavipes]|nr:hypothetical protein TNCV_2446551 [Trichonephila clavipes]
MDLVILNHGQVTRTTPKMAPLNYHHGRMFELSTPHQRDGMFNMPARFNVHSFPTLRRSSSGNGLEVMTCLYHKDRVGQRCTLNLSRAETSSTLVWCGLERGGAQVSSTSLPTMVQNYSPSPKALV